MGCDAARSSGGVDLKGPYIQGPPGGRFIYLSWGTIDDDKRFTLFRRAKLWLDAIPPSVIEGALVSGLLVGRLGLTDRKGNPLCAAVRPPLIEWSAVAEGPATVPVGRRQLFVGDHMIDSASGVRRVILPYPRSIFGNLFGNNDEEEASTLSEFQQQRAAFDALPEDVRRTLQYAAMLDRMKRGEIMALMPFDLRIK